MSGPPPEPTQPNLVDIDVYCLKCGYNLRGLSGDPRRCPECFYMNPMGDALIPAEFISTQLRRMETAPTIALGCFALMAVSAVPVLLVIADSFRHPSMGNDGPCLCCGLPLLVALGGWLVSVVRFRDSCGGKAGWLRVLWRYHILGLGYMAVVFAAVSSTTAILRRLIDAAGRSDRATLFYTGFALVFCIGLLCAIIVFTPRVRSAAKGDMDQLQREVAVETARNLLRKRLANGKR